MEKSIRNHRNQRNKVPESSLGTKGTKGTLYPLFFRFSVPRKGTLGEPEELPLYRGEFLRFPVPFIRKG
jgi:hypothetical protein